MTLVDKQRQWAKATYGTRMTDLPRKSSFCSDVVAATAPLLVPDTTSAPRYARNDLVTAEPGVRAYAGVPLVGRDGLPLGALCVIDHQPRPFTPTHLRTLEQLAAQVIALLEQGRRDRSSGLLDPGVLEQARDPRRLRRALDAGELVPHC